MPETPADPYRLTEALNGDEAAWANLVDEFNGTMWRWARGQGLRPHDAEDVVQMVWFRLKDRGHTISDPRRLAAWLATTTRREAQAARRRLIRAGEPMAVELDPTPIVSSEPSAHSQVEFGDTKASLVAAFKKLSMKCQELLSMSIDQKLSYQELAEAFGTTIGSIGPTRQRCLQQLRVFAGLS